MKKIAVIVVTYNRKKLLKECLENLIKYNKERYDIYILDNCSTDGTRESLEKYINDNKIIYYKTEKNIGGAGGFSTGIKLSLESSKYDYIWVMDDDTIIQEKTLDEILEKARILNNKFSFLSSIALWKDGNLCSMNVQSVSSETIKNYKSINDGILKIDYASFVSCFINSKYIFKVGLPIKEFFIYGDDMEYTMRLSKEESGYLVPKSIVIHKMTSNEGINIIDADVSRINRYYYNYRNLLYVYKKYDKKKFKFFRLKCYYLILKILFNAKKNKFKRIYVILKALCSYNKFNPEIEFIGDKNE